MISELSYLGLASPAYQDWAPFGTSVLGCELAGEGSDGATRLRMDDVGYRLAVHPGSRDELAYVGWVLRGEREFATYCSRLTAAGLHLQVGDEELCGEREVAALVWFADPFGVRHELSWGKLSIPNTFRSPRGVTRFVTGGQGMGHLVLVVPDMVEAHQFYTDVLGFLYSDRIVTDSTSFRFYHVNGRHHSLALVEVPGRVGVNHLMIEVEDLVDVGKAMDACREHGADILLSLGQHTNDRMISFYVATPSGIQIEYGYGGATVDDSTWVARTFGSPNIWGHWRSEQFLNSPPGIVLPFESTTAGAVS